MPAVVIPDAREAAEAVNIYLRTTPDHPDLYNALYRRTVFVHQAGYAAKYYVRVIPEPVGRGENVGYNYHGYKLRGPADTDGKGWCFTYEPGCFSGQYCSNGAPPSDIFCAPVCEASACCIPRSGWQLYSDGQDGDYHALSAPRASTVLVDAFLEGAAPPMPPFLPVSPHAPPSPPKPAAPPSAASVSLPTEEGGPDPVILAVSIALGLAALLSLGVILWAVLVRRRRRVQASAREARERATAEDQAAAAKVAIEALPTRTLPSAAGGTEMASTAGECAVCLGPL